MSQKYYGNRRHGASSAAFLPVGILVMGLVGGALLLHATGAVKLPFLAAKAEEPAKPDLSGLVRVPRSARMIPAYAAVVREDLWDAQQGTVSAVYLRPEDVTEDMITDLGSVLGRVLKREKPPGYVFTKTDFFPHGTRPGPTAGIPPGKRAMRLKADDVPGLHGLNQGDRFDLVMTVSVELEQPPLRSTQPAGGLDLEGPYAALQANAAARADDEPVRVKRKHAEVRTIVRNGLVVEPVQQRKEITKHASLLQGATLQATPIEEIVIAVDPEEVAEVNLALAVGASLQVAMRSGQADASVDEGDIPDIQAVTEPDETQAAADEADPAPVQVVEVIKGDEKHLHAVPTRRVAAQDGREAP